MHAVRSPNDDRVALFASAANDRSEQCCETAVDKRSGIAHLQCKCSVNNVATGEAVMNPATLRANTLCKLIHEGNHIVIGGAL
jgi:collagenase-like PrtC family protease